MPKIFNTSWLAVILAALAFFMLGAIWYGPLFGEIWMAGTGLTEDIIQDSYDKKGPMIWVGAILLSFGQAIGVLMMIHHRGAQGISACLMASFWLTVTIAWPILAYASVWQTVPLSGFLVDAGHMLVGYLIMASIYSVFRKKASLSK